MKTFGSMVLMFNVPNVSLNEWEMLHERMVLTTERYGTETPDKNMEERHKLVVIEIDCIGLYQE